MITLKHLRYFAALAQHGHFGRAADSCAISQPALSLQVKDLEGIAGAPLVERGHRQIRLTALGETFAARARAILQSVDDLTDLARAAESTLVGTFTIGMIPTVAPYMMPAVIRRLIEAFPGIDLRPREAVTGKLIEDLAGSRLDVAVVALPVSEPGLQEYPLFDEEFILVRPRADRLKPVPSSDMLKEMRLLLLEEGHCFRDQALAFCHMSSNPQRELMEGSSLSTLVGMVGAGIGVTLIPEMAVASEAGRADVATARLAPPRPTRRIGMVWRKTNPLSEHFIQIGGIVREAHASLGASDAAPLGREPGQP